MQPPIRPRSSSINLAIWYFTLAVMHHTYQSQVHADALGGYYYLSSLPTDPKNYPNLPPPENGPIHTECRILKHVVESADEEEVGGLFHNGKPLVPLIITLNELGFNQQKKQQKQTTPRPKASSLLQLDKKGPRQWACDFIGWRTG